MSWVTWGKCEHTKRFFPTAERWRISLFFDSQRRTTFAERIKLIESNINWLKGNILCSDWFPLDKIFALNVSFDDVQLSFSMTTSRSWRNNHNNNIFSLDTFVTNHEHVCCLFFFSLISIRFVTISFSHAFEWLAAAMSIDSVFLSPTYETITKKRATGGKLLMRPFLSSNERI